MNVLTLDYNPLGRVFGTDASWKVYLSTTYRLPSYVREIEDTYPYADDVVEQWKKELPADHGVIICVDCNGKLFRAWRGGTYAEGNWHLEFDASDRVENWLRLSRPVKPMTANSLRTMFEAMNLKRMREGD